MVVHRGLDRSSPMALLFSAQVALSWLASHVTYGFLWQTVASPTPWSLHCCLGFSLSASCIKCSEATAGILTPPHSAWPPRASLKSGWKPSLSCKRSACLQSQHHRDSAIGSDGRQVPLELPVECLGCRMQETFPR